MEKKKNSTRNDEYIKHLETSKVEKIEVESEMKRSFIAYAMAVNVSRAIPDVRDGLKPVHRRVLYAMGDMNLFSDKPHKKCARIVGEVLGKYHPHGDSSVYEALVRLAQDFSINYPLVDGHGNFGSVDGDGAAAMRYTEARLSPIASEMLRNIDKDTVDFYPNFDETEMQPVVLPSRFPNLLVNGADGIAVGMATAIPPHNLSEVISATVALIDKPEIEIEELIKYLPAPDYPTGALILGRSGALQAYKTGRGSVIIRSRTEIEEYDNGNRARIIVHEIPYQVNKSKLIETIADMVKEKRIDGITDINDESDRDGMRIVIELKRDANPQVVLNTLFKHTQLQVSNGIILNALKDGEPKIMNLKEILEAYVLFQKEVIERRTQYDLGKARERAHILEGLIIALDDIDNVIAIIKASRDKADAVAKLSEAYGLSDKQTAAILEIRLQRLTALEIDKVREELNLLRKTIEELEFILSSDANVMNVVKTELLEISAKYGEPRRSEISMDYSDINVADLIPRQDCVFSFTHNGYIKRLGVSEYKAQRRGGVGITAHKTKEEDFVENMFVGNSHEEILFFTNLGKVYCLMGYEIPEADRYSRGRAIVNMLELSAGEKVAAMIPLSEAGYLIMATKQGYIKKTAMSEFESIRRSGKKAIKLNEGDSLISVNFTGGEDELLICSRYGKCIRFAEKDVRSMGRDTAGVRSLRLAEGDSVVDMIVLCEDCKVLTVTENGFGKCVENEGYRLQNRGGKGVKAGTFNEETGLLVAIKAVKDDDDIIVISDSGIIIRTSVSEIRTISRTTKGVRIMSQRDGSRVVSVAVTSGVECDDDEVTDGLNGDETLSENAADGDNGDI